jgi:hypothetical protein
MTTARTHLVAFLLPVLGCNPTPETSGTNTNWLRTCENVSECGDLGCFCGHCTPTCDSDADCTGLGGICSSEESAALECQGNVSRRLCLPACTSSGDCSSGQLCYRGACTHSLGAANCAAQPDALVCEDFEGSIEGYRTSITAGNSVQTVGVASPSGTYALESRVLVAPSTAYLRADFTPVTTGSLSMRGWIQVPAGQASYDLAPLGFWSDEEPDWALRVVAKEGRLEAWSHTTPLRGSATLSAGEWHCVEATIDIADAGRVQVTLDGSAVVDESEFDTLPTGGIDAVAMGTEWAGTNATIHVDRVLVTSTSVGCWR